MCLPGEVLQICKKRTETDIYHYLNILCTVLFSAIVALLYQIWTAFTTLTLVFYGNYFQTYVVCVIVMSLAMLFYC